jgi:hypothetical protein
MLIETNACAFFWGEYSLTRVPHGGPHSVASSEQLLDEPRPDEAAGSGHADGRRWHDRCGFFLSSKNLLQLQGHRLEKVVEIIAMFCLYI